MYHSCSLQPPSPCPSLPMNTIEEQEEPPQPTIPLTNAAPPAPRSEKYREQRPSGPVGAFRFVEVSLSQSLGRLLLLAAALAPALALVCSLAVSQSWLVAQVWFSSCCSWRSWRRRWRPSDSICRTSKAMCRRYRTARAILLGWLVGWLADDRLALGRRTERLQLLGAERQRLWHHPGDRWHWYVARSIETTSLSQTSNSRRCWCCCCLIVAQEGTMSLACAAPRERKSEALRRA